jgi:threonine/homoserine/homoserine lactone efflux protein
MEFTHWLSLFTVCLLGAMSPGPSLAVVMDNTLRGGRRAGLATASAHGAGVALYGLLTVTGLALLITRSPTVFLLLQILGAGYLLYLAYRALRSTAVTPPDAPVATAPPRARGAAANGFLVAFLNPKLAIFMLALFSQFLTPDTPAAAKGVMVATVGITDAAWYSLIVALVSHPAVLGKLQSHSALIDRLFGIILLLLGCTVMLRALMALLPS